MPAADPVRGVSRYRHQCSMASTGGPEDRSTEKARSSFSSDAVLGIGIGRLGLIGVSGC